MNEPLNPLKDKQAFHEALSMASLDWINDYQNNAPTDDAAIHALVENLYHISGKSLPQHVYIEAGPLSAQQRLNTMLPSIEPAYIAECIAGGFSLIKRIGDIENELQKTLEQTRIPFGQSLMSAMQEIERRVHQSIHNNLLERATGRYSDLALAPRKSLGAIAMAEFVSRLDIGKPLWRVGVLADLARQTSAVFPFKEFCVVIRRPQVKLDRENRLHNPSGPAIWWGADEKVYFWRGVHVTERLIETPDLITVEEVFAERNMEIRRAMTEVIGWERILSKSHPARGASDEWGTIWELNPGSPSIGGLSMDDARALAAMADPFRRRLTTDTIIYVIELVNHTPEHDGSFKHYFIRFDPEAYDGDARRCPQAAVASLWRDGADRLLFKDWRDYHLDQQS